MDTPENNLTQPLDEKNNLQDTPQPAVDYTEENIRHLDDMEQYQNKGASTSNWASNTPKATSNWN